MLTAAALVTFGFATAQAQDTAKVTMPPESHVDTTRPPVPSSGFQVIPKLGLGGSRNFLLDMGLIGYSHIPDKN
ncbi:MAG: hypothetical protein EOP49_25340, partial [Sphingobacteriales bacterium]